MWNARESGEGDGIISLVKDTAEGLSRLIADHIKLARVELSSDFKAYGRQAGLLTVAGVFLVIGYAFAWLAVALALTRWLGAPLAFLAVGVAHLVGGVIGVRAVRRKLKHVHVMDDSVTEVNRSVAALTSEVAGAGNGHAQRSR